MMEERVVSQEAFEEEHQLELSIRPQTFAQYIGQKKVKENLEVFIKAAQLREECNNKNIINSEKVFFHCVFA